MNVVPRNLVVLADALAQAGPDGRGALWRLAEQGRELDANLVRLPPDAEVGEHQEDTLDVLLVVLAGSGTIVTGGSGVIGTGGSGVIVTGGSGVIGTGGSGVIVTGGSGTVGTGDTALPLTPTTVTWLPRTSRRAVRSGPEGLAYLTVHRRRPGLAIAPAPPALSRNEPEGGEAPCALDRVCPECGRLAEGPEGRAPKFCAECGERLGGC
ncbi:hypothetical protein ACWCWD_27190 [Streptomyces sp. NPDC001493]